MSFGERFLVEPDLIPERSAGETFGDQRAVIDFAGGPYLFDGLSASQRAMIAQRFGELARDATGRGAPPEIGCRVYRLPGADFCRIDLAGYVYELDFEHRPDRVRLAGLSLVAILDWGAGGRLRGALFTCEESGSAFLGAFENFFRVVTAYRLLELGGVLLHSAGVVAAGDGSNGEVARLFLGYSGAGKTTLSRRALQYRHTVLSDDINAVLATDAGYLVERVPFAGELHAELPPPSAPAPRYPLGGLYRLEKNLEAPQRHQLAAMSVAQGVSLLVRCAPFVNGDPHRGPALFDVVERLARAVPLHALRFALGAGDIVPALAFVNQQDGAI